MHAMPAWQRSYRFLYFDEKIIIHILMMNEKMLVDITGTSFFSMPYHIHPLTPVSSTTNIPVETFSAFFSRRSFTSWGTSAALVRMPDTMPI